MRADCIQAVSQALGRQVSATEMKNIEDRITRAMKRASMREPEAFLRLTREQRYAEAARLAAEELTHEAGKRKERATLATQVHEQRSADLSAAKANGRTMFQGLADTLHQAELKAKGISQDYFSALMDTWQATNPRMLGLLEDVRGVRDLVFEMFGRDSGNESAKKGAQTWLKVTNAMRERANAAGFDIRKRLDWHLPQLHDTAAIRAADVEQWVRAVMPLLDRRQYLTPEGRRMNDAELAEALVSMKNTLQTEGLVNMEPTAFGGVPALVRRREDPRELHFKDPESWLTYHEQYGKGTVFTALQGHVAGLARDIALAEHFGPNPEAEFRTLRAMAKIDGGPNATDAHGPFFVSTDALWKTLSGYTNRIYNGEQVTYQRIASIAQGVRNVETFGKLQGALLSSVTDIPTYFTTSYYNRLPILTATINLVRSFKGELTDYANRAGLISESVVSDMNRWAGDNISEGWTGRVANATLRASLLTAWTDAIKRAFSVTMMGAMGKLSRSEWGALQAADRSRLAAKGITETDWQVFRRAEPEDWRGQAMLTPEAIRAVPDAQLRALGDPEQVRNNAISRLLGAITDEADYAAVSPDLYTRAALQRGTQRGTIEGEVARSLALFKSFPFAMISRHWVRALEAEGLGSKIAYASALTVSLTLFGAIGAQLKFLRDGKDPADMTDPKFWGTAFVQGGGAGVLGDYIYAGIGGGSRHDQSLWSTVLGPVAGTVEDAIKLTLGNLQEAAKGKDTHAGAEALKLARSHLPLVNLWYLKTVLDHAFLHELQEYLSPGYLDRLKSRAREDWKQEYWWAPGNAAEYARAPNFSKAIGE